MKTDRILAGILLGGLVLSMFNLTACAVLPGKVGPVIVSHTGYLSADSTGTYRTVVGEVQNTGSTNLRFVQVEATFYDQDNRPVVTSETYVLLDILLPGEKAPFRFQEHTAAEVKQYSLRVSNFDETETQACREFQILDQSGEIDELMHWYHIQGSYRNTGTSAAGFPEVIATCYDGDGNVIGVGGEMATQLEAGDMTTFDLVVFPDESAPQIANCALQVQCESPTP